MDISEIREKWETGYYTYKTDIPKKVSDDHIFDEDLSVRRNRELVKEHNDRVDSLKELANKIQGELNLQFSFDVEEYIRNTYGLNEAQARKVESFVYREHHAFMCDYFSYIDTYAEFASDIISAEEG